MSFWSRAAITATYFSAGTAMIGSVIGDERTAIETLISGGTVWIAIFVMHVRRYREPLDRDR